jgi:histidine phosphotransferase ChpT
MFMDDIDLAALLVSRVCHDLVSPVGAVVNGLEVLADETDVTMRADALRLVAASAEQASARLQFARLAFGAAGSAGAELDIAEVGRIIAGLLRGGKSELVWKIDSVNWPKDWAKLLMNAVLVAADCLPRGGVLTVEQPAGTTPFRFCVSGKGGLVRLASETERALAGDTALNLDGRLVQPYITARIANNLGAKLSTVTAAGEIRISAE